MNYRTSTPLIAVVTLLAALLNLATPPAARATVDLAFSPQDNLEAIWLSHIRQAHKFIHVACFGISNRAIVGALENAALHRGVEVVILEDRRQSALASDLHQELAASGCHIIIKRSTILLHDKMGVFDGESAIIGSYNLSRSAQSQDNSDVVIDGEPEQARKVEAAWEQMFRRETGSNYQVGTGPAVRQESTAPTPHSNARPDNPTPSSAGQVWVNTRSGKYFRPGTRWYGHTKEGRFMSEQDAIRQGYKAAKG